MQGDFALENAKFGKGICNFTKKRFGENKIWPAEDNHKNMCNMCEKKLVSNIKLRSYWQNIDF